MKNFKMNLTNGSYVRVKADDRTGAFRALALKAPRLCGYVVKVTAE